MKLPIIAGILLAAFPVPAEAKTELDCLTRIIDHEARGEPEKGKEAVAYVVINRTQSPKFASTICGVATEKGQFSNFTLNKKIPPKLYENSKAVASNVTIKYNQKIDPTNGALYFARKAWSYKIRSIIKIGAHSFWK